MKLLLIEDDLVLCEALTQALKRESFIVSSALTGKDALDQYLPFQPDLLILDLGLPDMDGIEVLRRLRKNQVTAPVLILTARDGLDDMVEALDYGANDYLVKPFEMPELLARLRVLSRQLSTAYSSKIKSGQVTLDTASHRIIVNDEEVSLSRREYMALKALMENTGRIQTKEMLENSLYGWGEEVGSNTIEVHISNLRKKLPKGLIETVRGVGYIINRDKYDQENELVGKRG